MKDDWKILKTITVMCGVLIVLSGISFMKSGIISEWNIAIRISDSQNRTLFGLLFIALGIVCIAFGIKKKRGIFEHDTFLICAECRKTFRESDIPEGTCPECKGRPEPLDGFYDRHPEYKDGKL